MGFFSFITQDTNKSIYNHYSGLEFPVVMTDNKGNRWVEDSYGGYGVFRGKDYYELLAEMNGLETREQGIDLYFKEETPVILYPNLTEDMQWTWRNKRPDDCPYQGFFESDDEDIDEIEDSENWKYNGFGSH